MTGMALEMGIGGLIWMLLFWSGLILLAIWLVSLLFPATPPRHGKNKNSGEQRVNPNDKTTL
jgi:hypothetical protein